MSRLVWTFGIITALIIVYIFWIRPKMKEIAAFRGFYEGIEGKEASLWQRICGWRTVIIAFVGLALPELVMGLQEFQIIDWSTFFDEAIARRIQAAFMFLGIFTKLSGMRPNIQAAEQMKTMPSSTEDVKAGLEEEGDTHAVAVVEKVEAKEGV
jgi:hypothetical protein